MHSHVSIPKTMQKLTRTSGIASEVIWQSLLADKNLRYLRFKNTFVPLDFFCVFFALLVYYLSEVFKVCLELCCCFLELVLAETTI